jgi:rRNA maturation protein Nop10
MEVRRPVWTLNKLCPVCGQGSCLVFVACPDCERLFLRCDEDGSVFANPRDLSDSPPDNSFRCGCGRLGVAGFPNASDDAIRAGGFTGVDIG